MSGRSAHAARDDCGSVPRARLQLYAVEVELKVERVLARRYAPHEVVPVKLAQSGKQGVHLRQGRPLLEALTRLAPVGDVVYDKLAIPELS